MIAEEHQRIVVIGDNMILIVNPAAKMEAAEEDQEPGQPGLAVRFTDHTGYLFLQRRVFDTAFLQLEQFSYFLNIAAAER